MPASPEAAGVSIETDASSRVGVAGDAGEGGSGGSVGGCGIMIEKLEGIALIGVSDALYDELRSLFERCHIDAISDEGDLDLYRAKVSLIKASAQ